MDQLHLQIFIDSARKERFPDLSDPGFRAGDTAQLFDRVVEHLGELCVRCPVVHFLALPPAHNEPAAL